MAQSEIAAGGQKLVALSLASLTNIYTLMMYAVLVPLLVFFFLKDREVILGWLSRFLRSYPLTWDRIVRLVKDVLGINRLSVIEALSTLRQGEDTSAPDFVDKYDRIVREVGEIDEEMAKTYLV